MPNDLWYRLCVDVDQSGNPIGCSYEAHVRDHHVSTHVINEAVIGPFDTPAEVLAILVRSVTEHRGWQDQLPLV